MAGHIINDKNRFGFLDRKYKGLEKKRDKQQKLTHNCLYH